MDSLFRQCFSCCIRVRSRSPAGPNERNRLIEPPRDAVLPPVPAYVGDQQRLKERVDAIVSSKRSMMVDVNAPLPFNLRNQALHLKFDPTSRRLSDTSDGAGGSRMPSYSPTRSRDLSPSLQTSRSTTSLHAGDTSLPLAGESSENGSRQPMFNARLIPVNGGFRVGVSRGRSTARGRLGRFGEERGKSTPDSQHRADESDDQNEEAVRGGELAHNPPEFVDSEATRTPTIHSPNTIRQVDAFGSNEGTPQAMEFRIQDVGKISRSWGD